MKWLPALALLLGCSTPPGKSPPAPDAGCDRNLGPVAHFTLPRGVNPAPLLSVPFPSDLYRDSDGTLADDLSAWDELGLQRNTRALATALRDLDGFGRNSGALFLVDDAPCARNDAAVDPRSLPSTATHLAAEASAVFVDLDAEPARARVPAVAGWSPAYRTVTVQPDGVVLRPGRRYAAIVTAGVRTRDGVSLRASPDFIAVRDNAPGARSSPAGRLHGEALDAALERLGGAVSRQRVVALTVFTTHTRHRQLHAAAEALRAGRYGPAPALSTDPELARPLTVARFGEHAHDGWTATLEAWLGAPRRVDGRDLPGWSDDTAEGPGLGVAHDALGAVFTGTLPAPDFRDRDGRFTFGPDGAPVVAREVRIPVTVALPRGPMPPEGFPVALWGHGLSSQRRSMLAIANGLAREGIATVALDVVTFGQRADPTDVRSLQAGSYQGPDGLGDARDYSPAVFFGNLQSLTGLRDNLRQGALDLVQLRRMLPASGLPLPAVRDEYGMVPALDGTRVAYVADSLGGILGTLFAAVEPSVDPVVLNVPGGALFTAVATDAPTLGVLVGALPSGLFGAPSETIDRFHPVLNLLQAGIDLADPACFAAEVTHRAPRGHDVWLVEALWDEIIANRSTELLAREMALPQLLPATEVPGLTAVTGVLRGNLPGGATGAFSQCVPCTHGGNIAARYGARTYEAPFPREAPERYPRLRSPVRVRQPIVAYQRAIGRFLASRFAGDTRLDAEGLEPVLDLDDDGWTDTEERAAGTHPQDPESHPAGPAPHPRDVGF